MLTQSQWQLFQHDMARCLWAVLPPEILWGASVPLALAAVTGVNGDRQDPGRVVGGVYAANTLGAIVGALSVSLVLIPWIGTQNSERLLLAMSALSALFVLAPRAPVIVSLVIAWVLALSLDAVPGALIAYGRRRPSYLKNSQIISTATGRT